MPETAIAARSCASSMKVDFRILQRLGSAEILQEIRIQSDGNDSLYSYGSFSTFALLTHSSTDFIDWLGRTVPDGDLHNIRMRNYNR